MADINIQIQNFKYQLKNIESQFDNIMNIPNSGSQLQNIGIQVINIGIQMLYYILQMSNVGVDYNSLEQQIQNSEAQIQNIKNKIRNNINMQASQMNQAMQMNPININNNDLLGQNNNNIKQKIKVIFLTTTGLENQFTFDYGISVNEMLNKYLNYLEIKRTDGIVFVYNGTKLNLNDNTKVEEKFRDISSDQIIRLFVIDENTIIG